MKLDSIRGIGASIIFALAVPACGESDAPEPAESQGTATEVAAALAGLPAQAGELAAALRPEGEQPAMNDGGCQSQGGCGSAEREGLAMGGPMLMMPMPGPSMMGDNQDRIGMNMGDQPDDMNMPMGAQPDDMNMPTGAQPGDMNMPTGAQPGDMNMGPNSGSSSRTTLSVHQIGALDFFLDQEETLGLTAQQQQTLAQTKQQAYRTLAEADREIEAAEEALWDLTAEASPNITSVREQVDRSTGMTARRRADFIMEVAEAAKVLTDAQLQRLNAGSTPEGMDMGMDDMNMGTNMNMGMRGMDDMNMGTSMGMRGMDDMNMGMRDTSMRMDEMNPNTEAGGTGSAQRGDSTGDMNMEDQPSGTVRNAGMAGTMGRGMDGEMGLAMMGRNPAATGALGDVTASLPGFPGRSHLYHVGATGFFLDHPEHTQLTDTQRERLTGIKQQAQETLDDVARRIALTEHELYVMTAGPELAREPVDAVVERIASLHAEGRLAFIQAVGRAASTLTDSQRRVLVGTVEAHRVRPARAPATPGGL